MTTDSDRRYSDDEVARILGDASEAEESGIVPASSATGLTLEELRDIGREVGISEQLITRAATALDRPRAVPSPQRRFLGTTVGVGHTLDLPRVLTEREWDRLIVDLRETFDARGTITREGSFRQWQNGNLQALLEPTETGQRLRLKTVKGNGVARLGSGAVMMGFAAFRLAVALGGEAVFRLAIGPLMLGLLGAVLYGSARFTLPSWRETRLSQMEEISARLIASVEATNSAVEGTDVTPAAIASATTTAHDSSTTPATDPERN